MRRMLIVMMLSSLALVACGGDDDEAQTPEPEVIETTAAEPGIEDADQDEFVTVLDDEVLPITESCVDNSGVYKAQLEGGGLFILRGGSTPQESFVDFQASADADPLSSRSADDTVLTAEGSFTTGTTTVYTEDGANSLKLEFGIVIGEIDETC